MDPRTCFPIAALTAAGCLTANAVLPANLEVYHSFDAAFVTATTLTDQQVDDGNADNAARTALTTFNAGAKFGDALDVSTVAKTPRAVSAAAGVINSTWMPGSGDYTLAFWYRQGAPGANRIFDAGARADDINNDDGLQLSLNADNSFQIAYHDPAQSTVTRATFAIPAANHSALFNGTAWNHLAIIRSGTNLSLWVNGVNAGATTLPANYNIAVNTATYYREPNFGPDQDTVAGAAMDDLGIWHRALSTSEIGQLWNGGSGATILSVLNQTDPVIGGATSLAFTNNGAAATLTIPFKNDGQTQNLTLSSATFGGADAARFSVNTFTSPLAPGATGNVVVNFTPAGARTYTADLILGTNDPLNPSRTVNLSVQVIDPVASIPATLDFGALPTIPGLQTKTLSITNTGGASALQVTSATLADTGSKFTVSALPGPIAPGQSANLTVSFNPGTETGPFLDRLVIQTNDSATPERQVTLTASVATPAAPKTLLLANGNFDANAWGATTAPTGWTTSGNGSYGQGAPATPNLGSNAAHFQSVGNVRLQQALADANPGLTASGMQTLTIGLDLGYRNDAVTSGSITVRVSLRDLTNDVEIAGRDLLITDTGVQAGAAANQFGHVDLRLAYNAAAYTTETVGLRIQQVSPVIAVNPWMATALVDNVTLGYSGSFGTASSFSVWATGAGLTAGVNAEPTDDPDFDGIENFQEFAFGGNPLSSARNPDGAMAIAETSGDTLKELVLTVAVRAGAAFTGNPSPTATVDGLTYTIEGSTSLTTFTEPVTGPLANPIIPAGWPANPPAGYAYVSFRLSNSNGLPGRGFLRARATGNP